MKELAINCLLYTSSVLKSHQEYSMTDTTRRIKNKQKNYKLLTSIISFAIFMISGKNQELK